MPLPIAAAGAKALPWILRLVLSLVLGKGGKEVLKKLGKKQAVKYGLKRAGRAGSKALFPAWIASDIIGGRGKADTPQAPQFPIPGASGMMGQQPMGGDLMSMLQQIQQMQGMGGQAPRMPFPQLPFNQTGGF